MIGLRRVLILGVVSLVLAAACSAAGSAGGTVNTTLSDTKIVLDRASVPGGNVTFTVKNAGTIEHELVVLRTDVAADKIEADVSEPGKMSEEGSLGESGDLAAGETKSFTLQLSPGKYVLMCNQPGHYLVGMHLAFEVK